MQLQQPPPPLEDQSVTFVTKIASRSLLAFQDYWRSKCAGGDIPRRADIDPADIPWHLPRVFMVDVIDGGADYRYRLVGTLIVSTNERDLTGRRFSEFHAADPAGLAAARLGYDRVLASRGPVYMRGRTFWRPNYSLTPFECIYLPLRNDNDSIDIVFGEIDYLDVD